MIGPGRWARAGSSMSGRSPFCQLGIKGDDKQYWHFSAQSFLPFDIGGETGKNQCQTKLCHIQYKGFMRLSADARRAAVKALISLFAVANRRTTPSHKIRATRYDLSPAENRLAACQMKAISGKLGIVLRYFCFCSFPVMRFARVRTLNARFRDAGVAKNHVLMFTVNVRQQDCRIIPPRGASNGKEPYRIRRAWKSASVRYS